MPKKSARTTKRVVARSVTPKLFSSSFWRTPRMLMVIALVALAGGYFLYQSFALTNTVTYSGSFTKKHPSASYTITTTAPGVITATASYSNTNNFKMSLLTSGTLTTSVSATISGVNPQTLTTTSLPAGSYTLTLSGVPAGKGSGSYTVTVSYPVADTVPPVAAITSPASGASITGLTNIEGTATDNDGVAKVEVSVDSGALALANLTGTSSSSQTWGYLLDTTKLANGSHTVTAKVTDLTGNIATASATYTVSNNVAPPSDTTPPSVAITAPTNGSTVFGTTTFQGTASDNVGVAKVQYRLDNAASWSVASGTSSWSFAVDTTQLNNNANHVVYVQALDSANNNATTSESVFVSNQTYTSTAPNTQGTWVSPEGVSIVVDSTGIDPATGQPWTIASTYQRLKDSALDLTTVGPHYTIDVQDQYSSQTMTSSSYSGGTYSSIYMVTYLDGASSNFSQYPDYILAHEYGHAWSTYYYYAVHQASWLPYEQVRCTTSDCSLTLATDSRTNSTYSWEVTEIFADDYRLLFGSSKAISEHNGSLNQQIPDPRNVTGLKDWLYNNWR